MKTRQQEGVREDNRQSAGKPVVRQGGPHELQRSGEGPGLAIDKSITGRGSHGDEYQWRRIGKPKKSPAADLDIFEDRDLKYPDNVNRDDGKAVTTSVLTMAARTLRDPASSSTAPRLMSPSGANANRRTEKMGA